MLNSMKAGLFKRIFKNALIFRVLFRLSLFIHILLPKFTLQWGCVTQVLATLVMTLPLHMESQPQNPEFRNNPENIDLCGSS